MSPGGLLISGCALLWPAALAWPGTPADSADDALARNPVRVETPAPADSGALTQALRDGVFDGQSPGWTGMTVRVSVDSGRIREVRVVSARGSARFYERVLQALPERMVQTNGMDVDGVTGATLSSRSLIDAVRTALAKARAPAG